MTANEPYIELAERLNALAPGDHDKKTMFANSGAEAVENAVKIARKHTGRSGIVVFDHAFHGRTLMAMSLTAKVMPYKQGMGPFAPEIYRLPLAYPYRCPTGGTEETCAESCLAYAIDEMHKHIGEENIAAEILIEPIQGEGGFIVPAPGFIAGLAGLRRGERHRVHRRRDPVGHGPCRPLVRDRGRGRRPRHRPQREIARRRPADLRRDGAHRAHGQRACRRPRWHVRGEPRRGGRRARGTRQDRGGGTPRAVPSVGATIDERLRGDQERFGAVGDVRGRGAMRAMELVADRATKEPLDAATMNALARSALERGLIVLTAGTYGNVVRLLPPITIDDGLLDEGLDLLEEAFAATAG